MSTHGLMVKTNKDTYQRVGNEWTKFKYKEAIANHDTSMHWVDDVNQRRHAPIGLEVKKPKYTGRYDASEKVWTMSSQAYLKH